MVYKTTKDIVIPAGTVLSASPRERGGNKYVESYVALGKDFTGVFVVQVHKDAETSGFLEKENG